MGLKNELIMHHVKMSSNSRRTKRFPWTMIASGASWLIGQGINQFFAYKRDKDIKKGLKILSDRQGNLQSNINSVKGQFAHYVTLDLKQKQHSDQMVRQLRSDLSGTQRNLDQLRIVLEGLVSSVNAKTDTIPVLSKLNQIQSELGIATLHDMPVVANALRQTLEGVRDGRQGVLRHRILPYTTLAGAFDQARSDVKE